MENYLAFVLWFLVKKFITNNLITFIPFSFPIFLLVLNIFIQKTIFPFPLSIQKTITRTPYLKNINYSSSYCSLINLFKFNNSNSKCYFCSIYNCS